MIDIRHLKAFVAVAEELNFHRAAERLHIVQPALSRLIKNLEEVVGVSLLERSTRHVRLTEAGKVFLDDARATLARLTGAVRAAREADSGATGTLRLAYMDFAVHRLLPDMVAAAAVREPGIRAELVYMSTAQQRQALIEGRIDLGIIIGTMSAPSVETRLLAEEPLVVAMAADHPLAAGTQVAPRDILGEPLLLGSEGEWSTFRDRVFSLYADHDASPRIAQEASSAAALFGLVARGVGITLYAGDPAVYAHPRIAVRPLAGVRPLSICAAWRRGPRLALVRRFLAATDAG
jgi:DNA-binding transcriptional LysR family regulator